LEQESADFRSLALREYFLRHLWGRFFCFAQFDYSRYHSVLLKRGCEIPTYAIGVILQRRILHWILLRLAAYIAVVVAVGLLFLAGASVYALMWPKPVVPFGQMGH
jgi:hypothetical protein